MSLTEQLLEAVLDDIQHRMSEGCFDVDAGECIPCVEFIVNVPWSSLKGVPVDTVDFHSEIGENTLLGYYDKIFGVGGMVADALIYMVRVNRTGFLIYVTLMDIHIDEEIREEQKCRE